MRIRSPQYETYIGVNQSEISSRFGAVLINRVGAIFFGLRRALWPMLYSRLRVADGLGPHLAKLSLRFRHAAR
jgi:hypothetical protein